MRTRRVFARSCLGGLIALAPVLAIGAEPVDLAVTREMIAVGDHRLQLARSGTGGPTVVFEAGMSDKLDQPDLVLGAIRWVVAAGRWPR